MYDLTRFLDAHEEDYDKAFHEIHNGYKRTHWMWYIFSQIHGFGRNETAKYYELKSVGEAKAYLDNPTLRFHLIQICEELLKRNSNNPTEILGYSDNLKLKFSMTLFNFVESGNSIFKKVLVLDKYYNGEQDNRKLGIGIIQTFHTANKVRRRNIWKR